jgi:hypothetical protein
MIRMVNQLTEDMDYLMQEIAAHEMYFDINSAEGLKIFMEAHVFAVWDFVCLLKELHRQIVATSAPWFPPKDALTAHLIGCILVEEESDINIEGDYSSHFEMYLSAMEDIGASTTKIRGFLQYLKTGFSVPEALSLAEVPQFVQDFVLTTFSFFDCNVHQLAASFVFGREGITSKMFVPLLQQLQKKIANGEKKYEELAYYLNRHIELDGQEHFPKALQMLENLIDNDSEKLMEARIAAELALEARIKFLKSISVNIKKQMSQLNDYVL